MRLTDDVCSRALETRDARFDGVFFVGIRSTGIYCRPICPARATLRRNRRYFSNAGAAERSGFRPCLRCRPELAPGQARTDAVPRLAQSAARRIADGALNGTGVDELAATLGVSARHLRRAMEQELGVSPIELAQTHRLLLAKQLLTETQLPIAQVAYASGFQSIRRFNARFSEQYRLNPQSLRRAVSATSPQSAEPDTFVTLALCYRPPLAWEAMLSFLARRAAPMVEHVADGVYTRSLAIDGHTGIVRVSQQAGKQRGASPSLRLDASMSLLPVLLAATTTMRRLFDLDADPETIAEQLRASGFAIPVADVGLRVPGAGDAFELAVRAILGQQVSVKGASTLMSRVTEQFSDRIEMTGSPVTHLPVSADRIASASAAGIAKLGMPLARATTIHSLAQRVVSGELRIEPESNVVELERQLLNVPGIGPWTAEYILMRAVHWPDAFPASDLVLRRSAGNLTAAQLVRASEKWQPWRAYAAMHLWRQST